MNIIDCFGASPSPQVVQDVLSWQISSLASNHNGAYMRVLNVALYALSACVSDLKEEMHALTKEKIREIAYKFCDYVFKPNPKPVDFSYNDLVVFVGILGLAYAENPISQATLKQNYETYVNATFETKAVHNSCDVIRQNQVNEGESTIDNVSAESFDEAINFFFSKQKTFATFEECMNAAYRIIDPNNQDRNQKYQGYAQSLFVDFKKPQLFLRPIDGKYYFANREMFGKMQSYLDVLSQQ